MRLARLLAPLVAPLVALTLALPLAGCLGGNDFVEPPPLATVETTTFAPSLGIDVNAAGWTRTPTGLYYRTLNTPPAGAATVANGQRLSVRYTLWLSNGTQIETGTYPFTIGTGAVIAGWDLAIVGMRVGEQRRLLVPPALGYGTGGSGPIPGNAVLVFDVEVLSAT